MSTPTAAVFGHPSYAQMDELIDAVEALTSIDNAMSSTSEHPVQNKAIKAYVDSNTVWTTGQAIANTSGSSGTLCTLTDDAITSDHVIDKFVAANPSVITSDITCTTSTGQAVITGTSTAVTTAEIKLVKATTVL